jgi:hypothetical protein
MGIKAVFWGARVQDFMEWPSDLPSKCLSFNIYLRERKKEGVPAQSFVY